MSLELRDQLQAALGTAYTLERELGGGGMSRVFVAADTALGRKVVIKVLAPELAAGVSADRFTREIRLAAQLQHPNIVPLHAAGDAGGLPYYTMPFVEGLSLRSRIASDGPPPTAECVRILRDVARALFYAAGEKPGFGGKACGCPAGAERAVELSRTRLAVLHCPCSYRTRGEGLSVSVAE